MSQKPAKPQSTSERLVRDIRRATRKHYGGAQTVRLGGRLTDLGLLAHAFTVRMASVDRWCG